MRCWLPAAPRGDRRGLPPRRSPVAIKERLITWQYIGLAFRKHRARERDMFRTHRRKNVMVRRSQNRCSTRPPRVSHLETAASPPPAADAAEVWRSGHGALKQQPHAVVAVCNGSRRLCVCVIFASFVQ
ncbi:unnamed protein product, partial [Ectocarpus sp. 8 AP-2014]